MAERTALREVRASARRSLWIPDTVMAAGAAWQSQLP